MGNHIHVQHVPRGALIGAALLIVGSISLAAGARRAHVAEQAVAPAPAPARASRDLRFEDRPDGTLAVLDADTSELVCIVPPASNGFVRGVLRGMFRERKLESMGHDARFRLAREAEGRLTLVDPQTGRRVDLDSFGPTNSAAFARFLEPSTSPTRPTS
jgi:putative photosynthetic complex assembly protein